MTVRRRRIQHLARLAVGGIVLAALGGIAGCTNDGGADPGVALSADGKLGKALAEQNNCTACHSANGDDGVGPTWKGLFGSTITLKGGKTTTADVDYLERAIRDPSDERRADAAGTMPLFGSDRISDEELAQIIAYIEDLATTK